LSCLRRRRVGALVSSWLLCAVVGLAGSVGADWISPIYPTDRAGIDSVERLIVLSGSIPMGWFGKEIVPLGDINGDGCTDILLSTWIQNSLPPWPAHVFYGGRNPDSIADLILPNFEARPGAIGDVNGDGYTDIGMYWWISSTQTNYNLYFGGPVLDDEPDLVIPNMFSFAGQAADFDGDGILDLPVSSDVNGGPVNVYRIDSERDTIPEYVIPDTTESLGFKLASGDFNGDGHSDLAISSRLYRDSGWVRFYWGGPDFDTVADYEIWRPSSDFGIHLVPVGDYNADGYEDIYIAGGTNDPYGVYFGGPYFDDKLDVIIDIARSGGYSHISPQCVASAGDVNNDTHPDIIASDPLTRELHLFLGGPDVDSFMYADVFITEGVLPGVEYLLGFEVTGIGDFNGDGIDDFAAFSLPSRNNWCAEVNIFAGWQDPATEVLYEHEPSFPDGVHLSHNYPNPFNPLTTIEFDLPRRSFTTLTVYNILGEEVVRLISTVLSPGHYRTFWDGCNASGKPVSSGVYIYSLGSGGSIHSRKMLLLK